MLEPVPTVFGSPGRKVFLFEQLLYQPGDLKRHHDDGDRACIVGPNLPQSPPHAKCHFCKRSFFSEEARGLDVFGRTEV